MTTFSGVTEEFDVQLISAMDFLGLKGEDRKATIKSVDLYLSARGVKLMSGSGYASPLFREHMRYESKMRDNGLYVDAIEVVDVADDM